MTGVFCNSAIKAAENDHDLAVQSLVQMRKELKEQVTQLFSSIDERGMGQLTISEFERHFDNDAVKELGLQVEIPNRMYTVDRVWPGAGSQVLVVYSQVLDHTQTCSWLAGDLKSCQGVLRDSENWRGRCLDVVLQLGQGCAARFCWYCLIRVDVYFDVHVLCLHGGWRSHFERG